MAPRVGRHCDEELPLAHSAPHQGLCGDPYVRHVAAVRRGARERAEAMLRFADDPLPGLLNAIDAAATFHDLGKLDRDVQAAIRNGRGTRLRWDHVDAGVAHLSSKDVQNWMAAWLVRAHHAPGLPQKLEHFDPDKLGRRLRGRRRDDTDRRQHEAQIARTDSHLWGYLKTHSAVVGFNEVAPQRPTHGLTMRLALSCLVDADHADTAYFDTGRLPPQPPAARWDERLGSLCHYVRSLPAGETDAERSRNERRAAFFQSCLEARIDAPMVACEGPVGLGKTTGVTAYLLRRAQSEGYRRLIIIAPYTNILTQTAARLREALVLPGERPDQVVAEHHHRADFEHEDDRDLAVLWHAPVVLTTAVSFFEALAACDPASLRKLHAVPGSAVFVDEAHAALPTRLWPQNWCWLLELGHRWGCCFVFASGSLARFWENGDIVKQPATLPELLPTDQAEQILAAERRRVRYDRLEAGQVLTIEDLIGHVRRAKGPRLVILNTVQNAAVVAKAMQGRGMKVLHLSTALCPADRDAILLRAQLWLDADWPDWVLVATSCVEAGVDLSFRTAFRERFATASTIQIGGRVNRHGEYDDHGGSIVYDFALSGPGVTQHPCASVSSDVLRELLAADELNRGDPAQVVTMAMHRELSALGGLGHDGLTKAEEARDYPAVAQHGRVIQADTRLVVVQPRLKKRLRAHHAVSFADLLRGSVQIWSTRIDALRLEPLPGRRELYGWDYAYDPDFVGYMAGVLANEQLRGDPGVCIL